MRATTITERAALGIENHHDGLLSRWRLASGRDDMEEAAHVTLGELTGYEDALSDVGIRYTKHADGTITIDGESIR